MKPHALEPPQAFVDLGLDYHLVKAVAKMQFTKPSDIQQEMIPVALAGRDILGQARTGTGKTAAFGLPTLQRIDAGSPKLQALCLTPTRELAIQVTAELRQLAEFTDLRCLVVYGGQKVRGDLHALKHRHHFVVGTPGRVLDLLRRKALQFDHLKVAVLDEVDRMLDIGFREDIAAILSHIRGQHQTIFVSATIDDPIKRLAKRFMTDPVEVDVSRDALTVDEVEQYFITVEPMDKYRLLRIVLDKEQPQQVIVFCNTKHAARKLAKKLHQDHLSAREIHGDLMQQRRERVMDSFRRHKIKMLIATDLAARGIDVAQISHIINYDIPQDAEGYVHRIGRTARMGARGCAYTFVSREQGKELTEIEKLINKELTRIRFEDFQPTAEPPAPEEEPKPSSPGGYRVSRSGQPSESGALPISDRPVTLGSKFRPRRRRRL